ncbi:hypothetical protein [Mucilaginibacter flavidus]|uniref:hypothetical protein n=1 Tax=Mucilaginibacter flavidus TaxID=2949309 RepID=UPI0020935CFF|nr:hypothetical protein [Mucilaginibacter flavidus]MCO5950096.1 hypothetical protein [Mucilaginibacter flavidus]
MAIVNILARSDYSINWEEVLNRYSILTFPHVEVFPIPKELGFEMDCIGINVHKGYSDSAIVISELKQAISFFTSFGLRFIELYDGIEIVPGNIDKIFNGLLAP